MRPISRPRIRSWPRSLSTRHSPPSSPQDLAERLSGAVSLDMCGKRPSTAGQVARDATSVWADDRTESSKHSPRLDRTLQHS